MSHEEISELVNYYPDTKDDWWCLKPNRDRMIEFLKLIPNIVLDIKTDETYFGVCPSYSGTMNLELYYGKLDLIVDIGITKSRIALHDSTECLYLFEDEIPLENLKDIFISVFTQYLCPYLNHSNLTTFLNLTK